MREQRCTHWCKHWWKYPHPVAATTVSLEIFLWFLLILRYLEFFFFFFFFFPFNSPYLFQILMVLRFACYSLQLQTKVGYSTLCFRGRAKLFWERCLPNAWVADLKGGCGGGGGKIMLGAQGWENTHCGSFYVVELIFMQLSSGSICNRKGFLKFQTEHWYAKELPNWGSDRHLGMSVWQATEMISSMDFPFHFSKLNKRARYLCVCVCFKF